MKTAMETAMARQRRFDAELAEVLGDRPDDGLADRIVARLRDDAPAARRGAGPWLVAAGLLLGVGIVARVAAGEARTDRATTAGSGQDPDGTGLSIEVRTVDVLEEGVVSPPAGAGATRLLAVAGDTRSNVVVAGVGGASSVDVNGLGARDAIEHIAREVGVNLDRPPFV
jgi:hypothetical protein